MFDFRGALPDTGASTVCRLGESSVAAREALVEALEDRLDEPAHTARACARGSPSRLSHGGAEPRIGRGHGRRLLVPPGRSPTVVPRPRAAGARALARARRLPRVGPPPRGRAEPWVFYEGPPTANGRPGAHHVLARVFKDIFPRYSTMRGYSVERKGGWDCHGLPVEIAVEEKLGFKSKEDIERYGIAEFNQQCRESVFEFLEDWDRLTERIGFWVDLEHAYRTLDPDYIESVWWALRHDLWDRDLLYEGHKVVPYCPR